MSNSFKLLTGPVSEIQKKYEILSDVVSEANGKVNGSQSHIIANNSMSLIVYYEVPAEGNNIVLLCLLVFILHFKIKIFNL